MSYNELIGGQRHFFGKRWLNGRTPMYLWLEDFRRNQFLNGKVHELCSLLAEVPFSEDMDVLPHRDRLWAPVGEMGDKKWWRLTGNGAFSVKSFYNFLNDGGLHCPVARFFW